VNFDHSKSIEISSRPPSAELDALAREGASRLASIDPRLAELNLSIDGGGSSSRDSCIVAHLEFLLPEHQVILSRCHPRETAEAVRIAFDAAAAALRDIARRDGVLSAPYAANG